MADVRYFARLVMCSLLLLTALVRQAAAHPVPFSYVDLNLRQTSIDVSLIVHIYDLAHDLNIVPIERLLEPDFVSLQAQAIRSLLAPRLSLIVDGTSVQPAWKELEVLPERQSVRLHFLYEGGSPGSIGLSASVFPYDEVHQTFVNVYEEDALAAQMILDRKHGTMEYFAGSGQGILAVAQKFLPAGIQHILIGPDHLLFLVGLLLLGGSLRRLALVVTSFTLGHSVTLSLAALNLVNLPSSLVEPAIALSIVYVGADNMLARGGRDVRAWIALVFGFIHGFGFASVLTEMGLPARALGWTLFSFNAGVEIGQLMVVVTVASALAIVRRRSARAGDQVAFAGSLVVMAAGAFWFVQRVFFPVG